MIALEGFNGEKFSGETAGDVVRAMKDSTWGGYEADGLRGYMRQVAKRINEWNGKDVRTDTPAHFLKDLEAAGFVRTNGVPFSNEEEKAP